VGFSIDPMTVEPKKKRVEFLVLKVGKLAAQTTKKTDVCVFFFGGGGVEGDQNTRNPFEKVLFCLF